MNSDVQNFQVRVVPRVCNISPFFFSFSVSPRRFANRAMHLHSHLDLLMSVPCRGPKRKFINCRNCRWSVKWTFNSHRFRGPLSCCYSCSAHFDRLLLTSPSSVAQPLRKNLSLITPEHAMLFLGIHIIRYFADILSTRPAQTSPASPDQT